MRRIETLLIVMAVGFYAWFLHRLGAGAVLAQIRMVGWGLGLTIALEALSRIANALGWRVTIHSYPEDLSFRHLFVARLAGEAVDYTTPSAQLGGQFVMALMVRHKLPIALGLATVVVAALAETLGQIGFMSGAMILASRLVPALHQVFWPVAAGLAVTVGLAVGFFFVQTRNPFSYLWKAAAKLNIPALANPEVKAASAEADALLIEFYSKHRTRLMLSGLCYVVAWAMGPVEIYLLLKFLGQYVNWQLALTIEALGLIIERTTFMIPAKLVSQEGGKALILGLLGYPAGIGFTVGLLRRIKEMAWVLFGLICFFGHRMLESPVESGSTRQQVLAD